MADEIALPGHGDINRVGMYLDPEFVGEIAPGPHVVVAEVPMDFESSIHKIRNPAQQPHGAFRHHMAPFEPEVNQVSDEMQALPLTAHGLSLIHI